MKQFETTVELNQWIEDTFYPDIPSSTLEEYIKSRSVDKTSEIVETLINMNYDLDNLVADSHRYELGGHTNNGWVYASEVGLVDIDSDIEIREDTY